MKIEVPFAAQVGESSVAQNSREKLVNMYAEIEASGRRQLLRRQRAGLRQLLANTGTKRAHETSNGLDYLIIDNTFYSFEGTALTSLGTISTSSGRCWIIFNDNGNAMISDGSTGYIWNGTSIAAITTPDNVAVGALAYQGGWGIFNVPNTGQWYITGINDFSSVDALDFATAEAHPDPLLRPFISHNQLLLCGTETIEIWDLTGDEFPFTPQANSQIERGLIGPNAIVGEDNTVYFVGEDKVIYRLEGYRPVRVSNGAIERAVLNVTDASLVACEMFAYTSGGQKFITVTFGNELTVQYNLATGFWNYAESYGYSYWRVLGSAGGRNRWFSTPTGIVALDETLNQDEGGILLRRAVSAPGDANGLALSVPYFQLDAEVGRAPINEDADLMLRFAPDGELFGNIKTRSLGSTGDYKRRVVWRNLGVGRRPTIEIGASGNFRLSVMAAIAEVEPETD